MSLQLLRGTAQLWRTSAIWWPLGWGIYVLTIGATVVSISKTVDLEQYLRALPAGFGAAFGIGTVGPGGEHFSGALYLLGAELFGSALIVAAIFAMFVAPGLVAREADRGTLDTLLARPLSRRSYIATRFAFFALVTAAFGLATLAGSAIAFGPIGGYAIPWRGLGAVSGLLALGALAFGGVGFLVAALRLSTGAGTAAIAITLAVMFVLNLAASAEPLLATPAKLSFFSYWQPVATLFTERLDWGAVFAYGAVAMVTAVASVEVFARRDIA
ncbi:MAG TPA: ABC transporter permease subunit [Candidatus Limnocylindria bacterium]|nr:ABC transporter permease subunit [Candidatus Limnocylindria bacterium]